jgi:aerobic-type carbon monoxide dehydrogenase small subunit (CoxS/CutS family)
VTTLTVTINGRSYGPRDVRDDLTMNDFLGEYLGMTGTKFRSPDIVDFRD